MLLKGVFESQEIKIGGEQVGNIFERKGADRIDELNATTPQSPPLTLTNRAAKCYYCFIRLMGMNSANNTPNNPNNT